MRFYSMDMAVVGAMSVSMSVVVIVQDKVDSFGSIEYLNMGRIVHQAVHPGLLEADISDAEVGFAIP